MEGWPILRREDTKKYLRFHRDNDGVNQATDEQSCTLEKNNKESLINYEESEILMQVSFQ